MLQKFGLLVFGFVLLGLLTLSFPISQQILAHPEYHRWEYMSIQVVNGADPGTVICDTHGVDPNPYCIGVIVESLEAVAMTLLNQYGTDGWELVTVVIDESRLGGIWNYYLRRPLE